MINMKNSLLLIVGFLLAIIFIYFANKLTDWDQVLNTIRNASLNWLILSSFSILASAATRAYRWSIISRNKDKYLRDFLPATLIGYLGNYLLPLRSGELIRIWVISRITAIKFSFSTLSSIVDRTTDLISLSSIFFLSILIFPSNAYLYSVRPYAIILFIVVFSMIFLFSLFRKSIKINSEKLIKSKNSIILLTGKLIKTTNTIVEHATFNKPFTILILLVFISIFDLLSILFIIIALGWSLPYSATFLFFVFISFGGMLPSTPGFIGIYQIAAILAFGIYSISPSDAVAFSIIIQGITAFSYLASGIIALLFISPRLLKLKKNF